MPTCPRACASSVIRSRSELGMQSWCLTTLPGVDSPSTWYSTSSCRTKCGAARFADITKCGGIASVFPSIVAKIAPNHWSSRCDLMMSMPPGSAPARPGYRGGPVAVLTGCGPSSESWPRHWNHVLRRVALPADGPPKSVSDASWPVMASVGVPVCWSSGGVDGVSCSVMNPFRRSCV